MKLALEICMLIVSVIFYITALGSKTDKQGYFYLAGGTITAVLLLVALSLL